VKASSLYPTLEVKRDGEGARARFTGVMLCGHIWDCPTCSHVLRAKKAATVEAAIRGAGGTWCLLTVTFRHRAGAHALQTLLRGLLEAWRRTRQGGQVQRLWSEHVTASVRATEVTYGANGWHPHVHVLIRTERWTRQEKAVVAEKWRQCIVAVLGSDATPNSYGIHWSDEFDSEAAPSRYLTKLGLELGGHGKEGRRGGRSQWQLAVEAAQGERQAVRLWQEYSLATKGHRMVSLDSRAATWATEYTKIAGSAVDDGDAKPSKVLDIDLWPEDVAALRRGERKHATLIDDVLRACETSNDPEATFREWIRWCTAHEALQLPEDEHAA
jgi:Replication protein